VVSELSRSHNCLHLSGKLFNVSVTFDIPNTLHISDATNNGLSYVPTTRIVSSLKRIVWSIE